MCGTVTVELEEAEADSNEVEVPIPDGPGAPEVEEGDAVVVAVAEGADGPIYGIVDQQRSTQLWVLLLAFSLALVAFGRWRGVTALIGLAVTFGILLVFMVPAIIAGEPPVLVALVAASAITLVVLYLTHGVSLATTVAVVGTMAALALTAVLSELAVEALYLTGVTDDISMAVVDRHGVDARGLLVASIIIGSVGVLDDVTVTQSAIVAEIGLANPAYRFRELYRAGSRVGRSHIASVVNTIVLAYAASSLPLIVLVVADNSSSLGGIASTQLIAQEVVRSTVATLGLIAAVPLTTGLAALVTPTAPDGGRRARPREGVVALACPSVAGGLPQRPGAQTLAGSDPVPKNRASAPAAPGWRRSARCSTGSGRPRQPALGLPAPLSSSTGCRMPPTSPARCGSTSGSVATPVEGLSWPFKGCALDAVQPPVRRRPTQAHSTISPTFNASDLRMPSRRLFDGGGLAPPGKRLTWPSRAGAHRCSDG